MLPTSWISVRSRRGAARTRRGGSGPETGQRVLGRGEDLRRHDRAWTTETFFPHTPKASDVLHYHAEIRRRPK